MSSLNNPASRSAVILAGGAGERFWPLSRIRKPKQLLSIQGHQSMLLDSIDRIVDTVDPRNTFVVTGSELRDAIVEETAGRIPAENILSEPARRNTSAALALAAAHLRHRFQGQDTLCAVLTADHAIRDTAAFCRDLERAFTHAASTADLVTFGIKPTRPETGFGYVETGASVDPSSADQIFRAVSFREKPSPDTAREFLETGRFLWNSGMFVWRNESLIDEMKRHIPRTAAAVEAMERALPSGDRVAFDLAFADTDALSIDYAVMERSHNVAVVAASFDWDDVGTWSSVARLFAHDSQGNAVHGPGVAVDCENTLIYCHRTQSAGKPGDPAPRRLIVGFKLEDLAIVETEDAILVLPMDQVQGVKDVVAHLRKTGREEWL
jgi:mannose-1-phosphate guanylyltransferase